MSPDRREIRVMNSYLLRFLASFAFFAPLR